jgi:hypothetical protein
MTSSVPITAGYEDFTEERYRQLVHAAAARYRFVSFPEFDQPEPICLWRHDIDFSPERARRLAAIEGDAGVRATYFLNLHSEFYNALERTTADAVRDILGMGHDLGLHFDATFYGASVLQDGRRDAVLMREKAILEDAFGVVVTCYSLHNPGVAAEWQSDETMHGGMVNAYCRAIRSRFTYVSDSNGIWRHRQLADVLADAPPCLHVLTHPGWWTASPMSPRERISHCIEGRARATHDSYDRLLAQHGRPNVGKGPE